MSKSKLAEANILLGSAHRCTDMVDARRFIEAARVLLVKADEEAHSKPKIKLKTIRLSAPWPDHNDRNATRYRVEQVTDSIKYRPGGFLEALLVEPLIEDPEWKVTIVSSGTLT